MLIEKNLTTADKCVLQDKIQLMQVGFFPYIFQLSDESRLPLRYWSDRWTWKHAFIRAAGNWERPEKRMRWEEIRRKCNFKTATGLLLHFGAKGRKERRSLKLVKFGWGEKEKVPERQRLLKGSEKIVQTMLQLLNSNLLSGRPGAWTTELSDSLGGIGFRKQLKVFPVNFCLVFAKSVQTKLRKRMCVCF